MEKKRYNKKRSSRKGCTPPKSSQVELLHPGKYDIYAEILSSDGKMVNIYKDEALEEKCIQIGLEAFHSGQAGGRIPKRRIGIELAIKTCLKKTPRISARALWDQFMRAGTICEGDYRINAVDAEMGIDDQKLVEDGGTKNDASKYLKFRAFKGYVSRLKKAT